MYPHHPTHSVHHAPDAIIKRCALMASTDRFQQGSNRQGSRSTSTVKICSRPPITRHGGGKLAGSPICLYTHTVLYTWYMTKNHLSAIAPMSAAHHPVWIIMYCHSDSRPKQPYPSLFRSIPFTFAIWQRVGPGTLSVDLPAWQITPSQLTEPHFLLEDTSVKYVVYSRYSQRSNCREPVCRHHQPLSSGVRQYCQVVCS